MRQSVARFLGLGRVVVGVQQCRDETLQHALFKNTQATGQTLSMLIPIEGTSEIKEFCMIEFQGEVIHEEGLTKGFIVGALSPHDFKKDTLELQIGYHRLEGTRIAVKKPLLVLYKESSMDGETVFQTKGTSA